jgi:hypothetical protein
MKKEPTESPKRETTEKASRETKRDFQEETAHILDELADMVEEIGGAKVRERVRDIKRRLKR